MLRWQEIENLNSAPTNSFVKMLKSLSNESIHIETELQGVYFNDKDLEFRKATLVKEFTETVVNTRKTFDLNFIHQSYQTTLISFHKHNVYKHTLAQICNKISIMLSIPPG